MSKNTGVTWEKIGRNVLCRFLGHKMVCLTVGDLRNGLETATAKEKPTKNKRPK